MRKPRKQERSIEAALFQGSEKKIAIFPMIGKSRRDTFQALENSAELFPTIGKGGARSPVVSQQNHRARRQTTQTTIEKQRRREAGKPARLIQKVNEEIRKAGTEQPAERPDDGTKQSSGRDIKPDEILAMLLY